MRSSSLALALLSIVTVAEAENRCSTVPSGPPVEAPVYSLLAGNVHLTIWRTISNLRQFVTALLTPITVVIDPPSGTLTQGDVTVPVKFAANYSDIMGACTSGNFFLNQPTAADILDGSEVPVVDIAKEFTLTVNGASVVIPEGALKIGLRIDGCYPCSAGQIAAFHVLTTRPGDLRAVVAFPDGTISAWFSGHVEKGSIQLPQIVVPENVPNGVYALQVILLDPVTGELLGRSVAPVEKK